MDDKAVSIDCVVAVVLWGVAVALTMGGTIASFVAEEVAVALSLMAHALLVAACAATWTVRLFFKRQNKLLRVAFRLGRESGGGNIRNLGG